MWRKKDVLFMVARIFVTKRTASQLMLLFLLISQIRSLGGPQPLSEVEYSNSEKQIAEISGSGIIEAQAVGNTVITGTAIGFDPDVGSDVTYSTVSILFDFCFHHRERKVVCSLFGFNLDNLAESQLRNILSSILRY